MKRNGRRRAHILYLSHYFPPEVNAPANRVFENARAWVAAGRRVTVLTGFPNHPDGRIPPEYRRKLYQRETIAGIDVHRCWLYATPNRGFFRRGINYLSFMVSAIVCGLTIISKHDCVIATSPQLFVAVAGWIIAARYRTPFVFEVRDIWPEEIIAVGAIKNKLIIRLLETLEMFLYRRATMIVAVARGTIEILTRRGIPRRKLVLLPNGVDLDRFSSNLHADQIRRELKLNGHFVVSYLGTIGMAHQLEVLLQAAAKLRTTPGIKFLIVGDGAEKEQLQRQQQKFGLDNVIFVKQQAREQIASYYHASDCCLVHLRPADLFTKNVPSKIYEIMACGKPILLGTRGEAKRLVGRAGCGVFFKPGDAADLVGGIKLLLNRPQWRKQLGRAGRRFVRRNYARDQLAAQYLDLLDSFGGQDKMVGGTAEYRLAAESPVSTG